MQNCPNHSSTTKLPGDKAISSCALLHKLFKTHAIARGELSEGSQSIRSLYHSHSKQCAQTLPFVVSSLPPLQSIAAIRVFLQIKNSD